MRTTLRIDDDLLDEVRRYAVERGMTLTATLEAALREMLARRSQGVETVARAPLPTFGGRGPRPGVDLHDASSLLDAMEVAEDAGS